MFSETESRSLLEQYPAFEDIASSLNAIAKQPVGMIDEIKEVTAIARKFNLEVVKPRRLELDKAAQQDPNYLPEEMMKTISDWGFYTMWIPKVFGGQGRNFPSFSYFAEEIASGCAGVANLIGTHYLGVASIMVTWNTPVILKLCREIVRGEKLGEPCLVSLALTEPDAGTDMEEDVLMDKGRVACHAQKVEGGYLLNGRKVFISNAPFCSWHSVFAFTDTDKPSESLVILGVKNDMKGFSLGKTEHKMGQKACPASELLFDNCFVPDEYVCLDPEQSSKLSRSLGQTTMQLIDYLFSASRAAVGAFGAGVARGAFEEALKFASQTKVGGRLLINWEWAQSMLAEMHKNVSVARLAYNESNYVSGMFGMYKFLQKKPLYYLVKHTPKFLLNPVMSAFLKSSTATRLFRKLHCDAQTDDEIKRASGWGSLAKFTGTDAGMKNCQIAMSMMGQAGLRHGNVMEKHFRDAKLMQIYEGTNQLNRLNLFKCLISDACEEVEMFEE